MDLREGYAQSDDWSRRTDAKMGNPFSLDEFYDGCPQIEEEFQTELDDSLNPRGPDFPFQLVGDLPLAHAACALDVGCGEGQDTLRLAERFNFRATGVDPVERHIAVANNALVTVALIWLGA